MTPPALPPAQHSVVAERLQSARTTHTLAAPAAVVVPGMVLSISSNSPAQVRAVAPYEGRGSLSLAWNASPDSSVVGYRLYFGDQPGAYTKSVSVGNVLKATVTGLVEGVQYYFVCVAVGRGGNESANSNEATGITGFYISIRPANWMVETYGKAGATNQIQRSTNLVDWTTVNEFAGRPGVLTNIIEPNLTSSYYRVRVKP